jgi:hypothetical protein
VSDDEAVLTAREARIAAGIRAVREGHGANCSSIGSVIDVLFASAVVGGALLTAIAAALAKEEVRVAGAPPAVPPAPALPATPTLPSTRPPEAP